MEYEILVHYVKLRLSKSRRHIYFRGVEISTTPERKAMSYLQPGDFVELRSEDPKLFVRACASFRHHSNHVIEGKFPNTEFVNKHFKPLVKPSLFKKVKAAVFSSASEMVEQPLKSIELPIPSDSLQCPECQKEFTSKGGLKKHMKLHKKSKKKAEEDKEEIESEVSET